MTTSAFQKVLHSILLVLSSLFAVHCVLILPNGQNYSIVKLKYEGTPSENYVSGFLIYESPTADYSGKIVLIEDNDPPLEPTLRDIISRGGVAAIARATQYVTPGFTEYWIDGTNTSDITISVGELEYNDWLSVNKTLWDPSNISVVTGLPSMNVTIDGWEPNPWDVFQSPGFIAWQVILVGAHLAAFVYTIYKLVILLRYVEKRKRVMALTICVLELIGLLIRIIILSVNPLGARKNMPYVVVQLFYTISLPFGLASNLLVLFAWEEILSQSIRVSPFLSRLLIPFLVLVIILFLLDLAGGITRTFGLSNVYPIIVAINTMFYAIVIVALIVWIFVVAGRVFKYIKWSERTISRSHKQLYRTTLLIVLSGCSLVLLMIVVVFVFIQPLFSTPMGYLLVWFFVYFLFTVRGFLQILSINVPKPEKESQMTSVTKEKSSGHIESDSQLGQEKELKNEETQKEVLENVSDQQTSEKNSKQSESNRRDESREKKDPSTDKEAQEGLSSSSASQKNNDNFQESDKSD